LIAFAQLKQFPIIPCNLCGSQENLKRQEMRRMIAEWDRRLPGRSWNVFGALGKVVPSHLMDGKLFDFAGLHGAAQSAGQNADKGEVEGDIAFDAEDFGGLAVVDLADGGDDRDDEGDGSETFPTRTWQLHVE